MAKVYIETTIPSYYCETRSTARIRTWKEATVAWWTAARGHYDLCTSGYVLAELGGAPAAKLDAAQSLLRIVPVLPDPDGLMELAGYYIEHQLMPEGAGGDAVHLAFATLTNCDFLLTWNCKHLANANKLRHLQVLNQRLGLPVPVLTTPLNLMPEAD
jgi:hypothetical protein